MNLVFTLPEISHIKAWGEGPHFHSFFEFYFFFTVMKFFQKVIDCKSVVGTPANN